jgi:hypothetical protein
MALSASGFFGCLLFMGLFGDPEQGFQIDLLFLAEVPQVGQQVHNVRGQIFVLGHLAGLGHGCFFRELRSRRRQMNCSR